MSNTYELRHKDHTVLLFQYAPKQKILEIITPERLPIPMEDPADFNSRTFFTEWYSHRVTRVRTREKRPEFKDHRLYNLITNDCTDINFAANLADHYWICSKGCGLKWSDINFFENDFDPTDENSVWTSYGKYSPDNHTNGNLRKFWTMIDGIRYLAKYNSVFRDPYQLGAHNEMFCTKLLQKLGIDCAEYHVVYDDRIGEYYSLSKCMTDTTYELVPAYHIMCGYDRPNHVSYYDWFLNTCKDKLGVDVRKQVDQMIALDYLIANEDRHWNNFGLFRNSDTLEYVGLAPIYDNEYSMGTDPRFKTRTFKSNPNDQLKYIDPAHNLNLTLELLQETWESVYNNPEIMPKNLDNLDKVHNFLIKRAISLDRKIRNQEDLQFHEDTTFQMYSR